jgi:MFS family permease
MSDSAMQNNPVTQTAHPSLSAIASIIISMGLLSIGNGLMFSYIPISLSQAGFDPTWAGSILSGMSLGSMAGCLFTNQIVRRVGHARAYMVFTAFIILSNAITAFEVNPVYWLGTRLGYGFAIAALFIIAQSWLNDAVENKIRGRIMAIFYITYIMGLGTGSLILAYLDMTKNTPPLVAIVIGAISILPIGITTLPIPKPPVSGSISFRKAWAISPVGLVSMLAVGGMSMLAGGFTPIHLSAAGYSQKEVSLLMFAMPIGTLLIQLPAGWISDRMDRRYVLAACALLSAGAGAICGLFNGASLLALAAFFILWDGATESIYSLGNAHAGDKAAKEDMVELSSTMLFAWSISGCIVPAITTALTSKFGTITYFPLAIGLSLAFAVFVVWRIYVTGAKEPHRAITLAPHANNTPIIVDQR